MIILQFQHPTAACASHSVTLGTAWVANWARKPLAPMSISHVRYILCRRLALKALCRFTLQSFEISHCEAAKSSFQFALRARELG
jgi:hypothetical protein